MTTDTNILAPIATLQIPDAGPMSTGAERALNFVRDFVIDSNETYELAAGELKIIKARADKLEKQRKTITDPLNAAVKAAIDLDHRPSGFFAEAEKILKQKMLTYSQEQERIAAETQRKADEAAAAERRRLEAEAAEKQKLADAAAKEAQQTGDLLAAARATELAAETAALTVAAQVTTAAPVASSAPKVAGISKSETWDFEVIHKLSLIQHIAARGELANLLVVDNVAMRAYVKSLKANTNLPGVRAFPKQTIRA